MIYSLLTFYDKYWLRQKSGLDLDESAVCYRVWRQQLYTLHLNLKTVWKSLTQKQKHSTQLTFWNLDCFCFLSHWFPHCSISHFLYWSLLVCSSPFIMMLVMKLGLARQLYTLRPNIFIGLFNIKSQISNGYLLNVFWAMPVNIKTQCKDSKLNQMCKLWLQCCLAKLDHIQKSIYIDALTVPKCQPLVWGRSLSAGYYWGKKKKKVGHKTLLVFLKLHCNLLVLFLFFHPITKGKGNLEFLWLFGKTIKPPSLKWIDMFIKDH